MISDLKHGEEIQMALYRGGYGSGPVFPLSFEEWEQKAREKLAAGPFGYVHGGAGSGETMQANRDGFRRYRIRPRICCDVSERDLGVELFGKRIEVPFLLAPIGVNSIFHPEAEKAVAKAAAKLGVPYVLSNVASTDMERIADIMGDALRWFQLYPPKNEELSQSFIRRAEAAGYSAIVMTVDSTLLGWRETDLRNAYLPFLEGHGMANYFTDPVFRAQLKEPPEENLKAAVEKALDEGNNTLLTWKQFRKIREWTKLPLLLKGITHPADALLAMEHGADGIVVSNHGGRQLDGAIGTIEALPEVAEAVNGKVPLLIDGGFRRGADILKAIALGAHAVQIGRPYIYGLAVAGQAGVEQVLSNLLAETELQLAISGKCGIKDVDRSLIWDIRDHG
ncbi:alpha-hydroxy-acid oxidizing protein [Cohnella caldifontis]|uniref:alpha-hydroxy-acid oxidizing protein n=1 Tax=Cohnella caldifontis TaxID=3027471 RepID=UPI0023ECD6F7|nr:alpha-hydroxy-acid oxidizing protein [Cohnella sp. YIM B05605]